LTVDELDTIVVPAREEGFNEVFLGENSWYSIRMSSSMIDRVKYIASYQKAPVSAITHYAEVRKLKDMKIQISILYISRIKLLRYRI